MSPLQVTAETFGAHEIAGVPEHIRAEVPEHITAGLSDLQVATAVPG